MRNSKAKALMLERKHSEEATTPHENPEEHARITLEYVIEVLESENKRLFQGNLLDEAISFQKQILEELMMK